jgi:murein DD-endopeptidase MepM/ murein hydrolase activator NlpD
MKIANQSFNKIETFLLFKYFSQRTFMIMRKAFILTLLLLFTTISIAQKNYPKDVFTPPLDIPLVLSGTFGELRSNHFHSGIDIKTQQREGLPVYAIADGVITRIKISHWGYGKALYIMHPNGYTSVYAHLQKFSPEIEAYVKKHQYAQETFEIELFPKNGELSVSQKEVVAYSGNSGGSGGPHLHFEIRNTASQKPINPLFFGIDIKDTQPPMVQAVYAYPLDNNTLINQSENRVQLNLKRTPDGNYVANKIYALGSIGFGLNTHDRQDLAYNKNGVYSVTVTVNGTEHFSYDFETFSFAETRYINTLIDYEHYKNKRQRIQFGFKKPINPLSIYNTKSNGSIIIKNGLTYTIELVVKDFLNNATKITIPVEGKQQEPLVKKNTKTTPYFLKASQPNSYRLGAANVYFPANTFYEDFYINLKSGTDTVTIHNNKTPVHKRFTVSFDASEYSKEVQNKMFIALINENGKPSYQNTYKRDQTFSTRTRDLGTYTLAVDTVAPTIKPRNFRAKKWLSNYRYLSLKVEDDLSGVDTYRGTLNGKWVLFEYDPKTSTLKYNFDDKEFPETKYTLQLVVTDNVGNKATYTATFFKKK